MQKAQLISVIKKIVLELVEKNYQKIYDSDFEKKLTPELIKEIIDEYNANFTMPPDSSFDNIEIYEINEEEVSVDCSLWADGERSDLTLIVNVKESKGEFKYAIEDIHIL